MNTEEQEAPPLDTARAEKCSQRFVVGFDAMGESTAALEKALSFACMIPGSHVEVVWVPPSAYVPDEPLTSLPRAEILSSRVREVIEEFGAHVLVAAQVTVSGVVGEGRPTQAISRIAFMHDADLIIVGAHEKAASPEDVLLGSVPKRLVEEAPCPVLVMRPRVSEEPPETEQPRGLGTRSRGGLPRRYHLVDHNGSAQHNMPILFP